MRYFLLLPAFLAGGVLIFVGITTSRSGDPMWFVSLAAGLALVIGPVVSILKRRWMREDLLAGRGVIARWQLSHADLVAFEEVDRHRASDGKDLNNWLRIPCGEIVIGTRAWLIGDRLYPWGARNFGVLANVFTFDGDPGYIEVAVLGTSDGQGWHLVLLRLPVPIGARPAARAAATHLAAHVRPSDRGALRRRFPDYAWSVGA